MTRASVGDVQWRAEDPAGLEWAGWDEDFALYHHASGQTHFLNASAAILLREILVEPLSVGDAAQRLAMEQADGADSHFIAEVAALILRLEELGLVRRMSGA